MKKFATKALAGTLSLAMVLGLGVVAGPNTASAAKVNVKKVTVDAPYNKTAEIAKGKTVKLAATVKVTPNKSANKKVTYKSANTKIVTVNGKGQAKGVKAGSTKITVTSKKDAKKKATIKVVVKATAAKKVKLNATKVTLAVKGKKTLKATVTPKQASKKIAWTSSKPKVAAVSAKGVVTAKKEGTATITAAAADGSGKKATCKVTVGAGIKDVTVPTSRIVRVTLTSAKTIAASNVTIQQKDTQDGSYNVTKSIESVKTTDGGKTYDIVLDDTNYISTYSWLKITISNLNVDKTKEIYVSDISGYSYETNDTITRVTGKVGETYSRYWSLDVAHEGIVKYSVSGLPAGLKAYVNKSATSVRVVGKFAGVENGTTAVLTGVDEKGTTYKVNYVFYVGDDTHIVGNALDDTELSYIARDPNNKDSVATGYSFSGDIYDLASLVVAGGSGYYKYEVTGLPEEITVTESGYLSPKYYDAAGNPDQDSYYRKAIPAGTYNIAVTVKDRENEAIANTFPFVLTLVDGVTLSGMAKDASGAPMKNANINAYTKSDAYGYYHSYNANTDKDGKYTLRLIPGDYLENVYYDGNTYDVSIGNVYTAGMAPVTKDFTVPLYKATFATIAGAAAYAYEDTPEVLDAYGSSHALKIDYDDYSMYAYLKAGTYEFSPAAAEYEDIVLAYSKATTETYSSGYTDTWLADADYIGRVKLSGSFTVAGNGVIQLTATQLPEKTPDPEYED